MHYATLFLYRFLPLEVLLVGLMILLISGLFSHKITKRFAFLKSRMRIIYGYLAIVSSIISMITFWYIYAPFDEFDYFYFSTQITAFSAGAFYAIGLAIIIACFISMVEVDLAENSSYLLFISLLLVESSSWFMLSSDSWINILFGFVLMFTGANLFIRSLLEKKTQENQKLITNYLVISSLALGLLFVGIACHSISGNLFTFSLDSTTQYIWEYLGIVFILVSLLILMGVPPFHIWFFTTENSRKNSSSYFLIIVQRSLVLMFLIKYSLLISSSKFSGVLVWLYTSLGIFYALWGVLGSITVQRLQKLFYYVSIFYIGVVFLYLSDLFEIILLWEAYDSIMTSRIFSVVIGVIVYIVLFSLSFSLLSSISKGFKTDEIGILVSISRNSLSQFFVNIFNYLLVFGWPIFIFVYSKKYSFSPDFNIRMYLTSITLIVVIILSVVYFIRLMKMLFKSSPRYEIQQGRIEPATIISSLLLCIVTVSLMILIVQFIEFCFLMSSSLLG